MPAPEFTVNTQRYDPYLNYRFKVMWDGRYVAGINKVSALKRVTAFAENRRGAEPGGGTIGPGQTAFDPITLERGVTHDREFEQWANKVWDYNHASASPSPTDIVSLKDYRKNMIIELFNEAGQAVARYNIYRCWVSDYQAMAELDGSASTVLIQTIKLENEGWQRDNSLAEPSEASFMDPE